MTKIKVMFQVVEAFVATDEIVFEGKLTVRTQVSTFAQIHSALVN